MQTETELKELVKQKYGEIALQDKETNNHHVAAPDAALPKCTIS